MLSNHPCTDLPPLCDHCPFSPCNPATCSYQAQPPVTRFTLISCPAGAIWSFRMSLHTSSQRISVSSVSFSAGACITNNEESSASMMFSMMANESLPQKEIECITIEDDDSEEEAYQSPFNDNSGDSAYGHDHYDDGFASYVQETRESYQSFEGDSKSLIVQNLLHGTYAGESFAVSNLNASLPQRFVPPLSLFGCCCCLHSCSTAGSSLSMTAYRLPRNDCLPIEYLFVAVKTM